MDLFVNQANDPLERLNRLLNETIPRHATMQVFIQKLKDITHEYVTIIAAIRQGQG